MTPLVLFVVCVRILFVLLFFSSDSGAACTSRAWRREPTSNVRYRGTRWGHWVRIWTRLYGRFRGTRRVTPIHR